MNEQPYFIWLDCDPGIDDAAAILCANALPELELVALSTVCGNVEPEKTYRNALRLNRLMGTSYPVYRGADRPWLVPVHHGYAYHGVDGLGGVELPLPEQFPQTTEPAWDALYRTALSLEGRLELIATGPLTNVATALTLHPDLGQYLRRIVMMGGAARGGNCTPAAEFNIHADPHAAQVVFEAGIPLTMCGLDVTNQATFTQADLEAVGAKGSAAARLFHLGLLTPLRARQGGGVVRLHDVVAVLYAARPEIFSGRMAGVRVETRGTVTLGKTVTDLYSDKKFETRNAFVVLGLDHERFLREVSELILSYE